MKRDGNGWPGEINGAVPTQGEGEVMGVRWYYRQRHGEWGFAVAATDDDAVGAVMRMNEAMFVRHGEAEEFEEPEAAWPKVAAMLDQYAESVR